MAASPSSRTPNRSPEVEPVRPYIGGQAVLEGVMMRAPTSLAVVVRRRDGSLHVRERAMPSGRTGAARLPFVRGMASLVESLKLGGEGAQRGGHSDGDAHGTSEPRGANQPAVVDGPAGS